MRVATVVLCLLFLASCLESNPQPAPGKRDRADSGWAPGGIDVAVVEDLAAPKQEIVPTPTEDIVIAGGDMGPAPADIPAEVAADVVDVLPGDADLLSEELIEPPDVPADTPLETAETVEEDVGPPETVEPPEVIEKDIIPPGENSFKGGGTFFGMCAGACKLDVTVDGDKVNFVASNWDDTIYVDNDGTLTPEGLEAAHTLAADLVGVELQETYGCPDCADGGGAYVVLLRQGVESKHTYSFGQPPVELELCEAFSKVLRDALAGCQSNALITVGDDCGPLG